MSDIAKTRRAGRKKRHLRVRSRVTGLAERPRLAVHRSLHHISAQVIDDLAGHTLAAATSTELKKGDAKSGLAAAEAVGKAVAERAVKAGIKNVVFDRGGYLYHGRVKALADAARAAGLEF
ncbi:MAG: large subunit ribosomal protein [Chloroflexota bacterium]|jgi:large subunit ribosomal protein L18|nr:large subunit ribosomal protein [Chloroflexota bacterium]